MMGEEKMARRGELITQVVPEAIPKRAVCGDYTGHYRLFYVVFVHLLPCTSPGASMVQQQTL